MVIPHSRVSHTQLVLPRKSIFQGRHQGMSLQLLPNTP